MKRLVWTTIGVILLLLVAAGGGAVLYVSNALKPVAAEAKEVRLVIPAGTGSAAIARLLEEHGLIRDARVFRYYLLYKQEGSRFQAGEYAMQPGMELDEIIAKMNRGDIVKEEMIRFTIPEGFTVLQIADRLSELEQFDRETFLALADSKEALPGSKWAADIPDDPGLRHRLEGYLFPETYEMKKNSTTKDIVQRMASQLDRKLAELPSDWPDRLEQLKLSFHEMMTIASLIEREVVDDEERPLVASVIYNRMKIAMKLQIDATVQYTFDTPKERLFEKDLQVDSPYNTYRIGGLPPGPIAAPSLKSIRAALYPAESDYLFYVTKNDGTPKHAFARTYNEHLKNVAESRNR